FWIDEGVAAVLDFSRGDGGTVFVQSPQGVSRDPKGPAQAPQVTLTIEHYGRIWRTLDKKIPVTLQMDIDSKFYDADQNAFNNVGNGTGLLSGAYQPGNEAVAPIFQAWMEPFRNMGVTTLTTRNTGGTDHQSYDAVGLPGFQFIQDEIEYNARTHHSNMDTYERIQANDMMRNAVIVASFAYNTANRDEKLPRKPLPKPQTSGRGR